jgi:hypothetical protein
LGFKGSEFEVQGSPTSKFDVKCSRLTYFDVRCSTFDIHNLKNSKFYWEVGNLPPGVQDCIQVGPRLSLEPVYGEESLD